jgi:hypothetical protein
MWDRLKILLDKRSEISYFLAGICLEQDCKKWKFRDKKNC